MLIEVLLISAVCLKTAVSGFVIWPLERGSTV